jgi:phosphoglucosamine mutase
MSGSTEKARQEGSEKVYDRRTCFKSPSSMSLFGSSGIRGVVGKDITTQLALDIGAAVGSAYSSILLAKDARTSGDMLLNALVAGATSAGANVASAGMVSTPTLARASSGYDCGLMVTASHNPPEYNGVKMWNPDGSAFDTPQMEAMEAAILNKTFKKAAWNGVGTLKLHAGAVEAHVDAIAKSVGRSRAKVVLDCGNGAASVVSPYALAAIGCTVTTINGQPDGKFPGRPAEPTEENLSDLKRLVMQKGADLGIAHDGDGDRMVAVDEKGRFVDGDKLLALFATEIRPDGLVVPIDASMVLDDIAGGKIARTRVGDVYIAEELKRSGYGFGGEPSGTFIFPKETFCPDGVYAAALLARMVSDRKLSEMIDALPSYPTARRSYAFLVERRSAVAAALDGGMRKVRSNRLIKVDGYRAEFAEGWFLLRLSGTEPKLRLSAEAHTQEDLERLLTRAETVAKRCLS